ncbi:MAG: hydroxypyruvate isomerase family protein [Gammaproteobacteria bacterium]
MPKFAANLSMLFNEMPFMERFAAAAKAGFKGVEYLFPYAYPAEQLAEQLAQQGLQQVLFNGPPGDWEAGERGLAAVPGREQEFQENFGKAIEYAKVLNCPRIHVMAGIVAEGTDIEEAFDTYLTNLGFAAEQCAAAGLDALIEPINSRDIPGFYLNNSTMATAIIDELQQPNLKLQLDLYHCQIMEGDLAMHLRNLKNYVGHIQIAGVPERHEPDIGEINYPYLFKLIDELAYDVWIGCEYRPRGDTVAGLSWFEGWR